MTYYNGRCDSSMILERNSTDCIFGTKTQFAPGSEVIVKFVPQGGSIITATGDTVTANAAGKAPMTVSLGTAGHFDLIAQGDGPQGQSVKAVVPLAVKEEGSYTGTEVVAGWIMLALVVVTCAVMVRHMRRVFSIENKKGTEE